LNLFRRKQKQDDAPTSIERSPLENAERAVALANERIAAVNTVFFELVERYQIRVDRDGRIAFAIVPDVSFRAELENEMRANLRARDEALGAFYQALNEWGGLKGATNYGASC
jgi:hypothetical protein